MGKLELVKLKNSKHAELEILNFGATIVGLKVPDKLNNLINVILALKDSKDYADRKFQEKNLFLGSTVGRYAGRIANGSFMIDKDVYPLNTVNGIHLHGGKEGFDKKFWTINHVEHGENPYVILSYLSQHLEEGYPGNLKITAKYQLTENNRVNITYKATTDSTTHINLTNHSYFNLNGEGTILGQKLYINSSQYLEVDEQLIPTGVLKETQGSEYDFVEASMLDSNFRGLDDTFILNNEKVKASLYSKQTGILMEVRTNQPAIVVFTPHIIEGVVFKDEKKFHLMPAICFETQKFPNSPNNAHFPSTLVTPHHEYSNKTSYAFSVTE